MSNVEKMSVSLTPKQAEAIRNAVADGDYGSSSEVVREALRDWASKREADQAHLDYLRKAYQEGVESGFKPFPSREALMAGVEEEFERRETQRSAAN